MSICQHCGRSVDGDEAARRGATCPYCGGALAAESAVDLTDVARVANLAEAGFLANDLESEGIDAQIHAVENFSGISGSWSVAYLVRVPSGMAQDAAGRIRRHVAAGEVARNEPAHWSPFDAAAQTVEAFHWRPVAVLVLTGVVCFVVGQQFGQPDMALRPLPRHSLPAAIGEIGRPLLTEPAPGQPRYRLSYQRRGQMWNLDADRDGDGRFDVRQQYSAAAGGR